MSKYQRISVNITDDVAAAFRTILNRRGISATEGIRRAIAIYKLIDDAQCDGQSFCLVDPKRPDRYREVVIL